MKIMKLNLGLIGLLFLSTLSCQNNSKTTEDSSATTEASTIAEVLLSEPGLSLGIVTVPNLRDLGGYKTIDEATQVATSVFADMKESEFTGHIKNRNNYS